VRADGWNIEAGNRVFAPLDGRIVLTLSTGTSILLDEGADMTVLGTGSVQVFRVDAGTVEFHVSKLTAGERFLVDTSDAEVEVRGTQFRVSVGADACVSNGLSRLAVSEGIVVARRAGTETRVGAGETWPSRCDSDAIPSVAASSLPVAARPSVPARGAALPTSALGEQNALFSTAVAARRRGERRAALAALDRLVATYPEGPLAESAAAERFRVLQAVDMERARAAARDYVARYPSGFARDEAEAVLAADR
jgi:hypothetical protein